MEVIEVDEIPVDEEPVQITDQIFVQDEGTRVFEPEMQESRPTQQESVRSEFDLSKLSYELQQGYRIYTELLSDTIRNVTWPFVEPVDADSLGLWDYYERIKSPMCLATIGSKFVDSKYNSVTEVVADVRLILENCYRYNGPNHWVSKLGQKLEKILEQKLALLNRSLRDKVTLESTMTINSGLPVNDFEVSGRKRSNRQNYLSMVNGENASSLVNHLKIIEESEEKERRRMREKEKKEANQALLQDLDEWEKKEFTVEIMDQLHSMWEIPSVGSLLYMVKDIVGIEDINLTEFEMSFVYPNKSSLLGRIYTGLLITPHQRKSIYKRPVMKFKMWESKLKEKLDAWYKMVEKEGFFAVSLHYGIDIKFFDIVGAEKNPLEEKSYLDLTIHQRVWVFKTLLDVCFNKDYDIREKVNACDFMEQRELFLGSDAHDHSYIYFPIFQTTDLRVYRHDPLEVPLLKPKELSPSPTPPPEKKPKKTPSTCTPTRTPRSTRLRQLRSGNAMVEEEKEEEQEPEPTTDVVPEASAPDNPKPSSPPPPPPAPPPVFQPDDGFHLACHDIETLKLLMEQFTELPPPPKKRGRRYRPPPLRKRCVVDLHETLMALLQELEKYEGAFSRNCTKAKIKIMKESLEPEPVDEPEEEPEPEGPEEWASDLSDDDDAGAKNDAKDEDYRIEDEYRNGIDRKKVEMEEDINDSDNGSSIAIQTGLIINKRKRKLLKDENDSTNSSSSIGIQTPALKIKKKPKKWSPTKEKVFPSTSTGVSPAVLISPVTAEESLRATTALPKGVATSQSSGTNTKLSPDKILFNVLGQALKRAQEHASFLQSANNKDVSGNNANAGEVSKGLGNTSSPVKTIPSSLVADTTPTKSQRKRILVSPEGKAHEIKPSFHIVSTEASSTAPTSTSLPSHPLVQRKSDMVTVVSKIGGAVTATMGPQGIRTTPTSQTKTGVTSLANSQGTPKATHQRPNILSRNKKDAAVSTTVVSTNTSSTSQAAYTVSSNHNYALPATLASKVVMVQSSTTPTSVKTNTTGGFKVVKIIPNAAQSTNVTTVSSLRGVPVTGPKTVPQAGLKTVAQSGQTKVATSTSVPITPPNIQNTSQSTSLIKTSSNTKNIVSTAATTLRIKPQGNQPVTSQKKIIFIPAASVDAKSPLASFKPQTLTTTSGQSIYGYAVVIPHGSSEEVNAVINSSLKKSSQVAVTTTQGVSSVQGKLNTGFQGKPPTTGVVGKSTTTFVQGKTSTFVQGKTSTFVQGKPTTTSVVGKSTATFVQGKAPTFVQGKPTATGLQGKPITIGLQGKTTTFSPGNPTNTALQGKPLTISSQGKTTTVVIQGNTSITSAQGKSTTVLQGKPTVAGSHGNYSTILSQGKPLSTSTVSQGKPTHVVLQGKSPSTGLQGKPLTFVIQGKPTDSVSKVVIGNTIASQIPGNTVTKGTTTSTGNLLPASTSILGSNQLYKALTSIGTSSATRTILLPVAATVTASTQSSSSLVSTTPSIAGTLQCHPVATSSSSLVSSTPSIAGTLQCHPVATSSSSLVSSTPSITDTVQRHPVATTTTKTQLCSGNIASTVSNITNTIQRHPIATILSSTTLSSIAGTMQTHPVTPTLTGIVKTSPSNATSSVSSSVQPRPVTVGTTPALPHSGKLTLLQLARSNIQAATTTKPNQPVLLVSSSIVANRPVASVVASKVTTTTQPCSVTSNLTGTIKPHLGVTTSSITAIPGTTQPHSGVTMSSTSTVPGTTQHSTTLAHHCIMTTTVASSAVTTQPRPSASTTSNTTAASTTQPHSDVITTVTNVSHQPQCGVTIETNLDKTDHSSPVAFSISGTVQLENVSLPKTFDKQEKKFLDPSSTETKDLKDGACSLSIEDSDTKSSTATVMPSSSSKEKLMLPTKLLALSDNQNLTFCNGVSIHSVLDNSYPANCIKTHVVAKDACEIPPTKTVIAKDASDGLSTNSSAVKDLCDVTTINGTHCIKDSEEPAMDNS